MKDAQLKIRHTQSAKDYPQLSLKDGEYVALEFRRATICFVLIWVTVFFAAILLTVVLALFNSDTALTTLLAPDSRHFINLVGFALYAVLFLGGIVTSRVFSGNRLFVTNKRAIQYEMISLFANSVNIIELTRIEDVSFRQTGLFHHLFGIGTIRMSTVGDETTYTFKDVYKPSAGEIRTLTDLVAGAKNAEKSATTES